MLFLRLLQGDDVEKWDLSKCFPCFVLTKYPHNNCSDRRHRNSGSRCRGSWSPWSSPGNIHKSSLCLLHFDGIHDVVVIIYHERFHLLVALSSCSSSPPLSCGGCGEPWQRSAWWWSSSRGSWRGSGPGGLRSWRPWTTWRWGWSSLLPPRSARGVQPHRSTLWCSTCWLSAPLGRAGRWRIRQSSWMVALREFDSWD